MRLRNIAVLLFFLSSTLSAQPISKALRHPHPSLERLERAIKLDWNPGHISPIGDSFLHVAAKLNLGEQIVLLMQVQKINDLYLLRNNVGQTAIEIAIVRGNRSAFNALAGQLRADDDIRVNNPQQWSLLHLAARHDRAEMISSLIEAGIPVNNEDDRGWSALDIARLFYAHEAEKILIRQGAVSTNFEDLTLAHVNALKNYNWAHEDDEFEEEFPNQLPAPCDVMNPLQMSGFWPKTY